MDDGVDGEAVALCSGLDALRRAALETSPDGILVTAPLLLLLLLPLFFFPFADPLFPAALTTFRSPRRSEGGPVLEQASPVRSVSSSLVGSRKPWLGLPIPPWL